MYDICIYIFSSCVTYMFDSKEVPYDYSVIVIPGFSGRTGESGFSKCYIMGP